MAVTVILERNNKAKYLFKRKMTKVGNHCTKMLVIQKNQGLKLLTVISVVISFTTKLQSRA